MNENIEDEHLIGLVHAQPILYDRKCTNFTSEIQKQNCWKLIASEFKCSPADCMAKWMTLRQKFVREKEKEIEMEIRCGKFSNDMRSKWKYMEYMRFMEPHVTLRIPSSFVVKTTKNETSPNKTLSVNENSNVTSVRKEYSEDNLDTETYESAASIHTDENTDNNKKLDQNLMQISENDQTPTDENDEMKQNNEISDRFSSTSLTTTNKKQSAQSLRNVMKDKLINRADSVDMLMMNNRHQKQQCTSPFYIAPQQKTTNAIEKNVENLTNLVHSVMDIVQHLNRKQEDIFDHTTSIHTPQSNSFHIQQQQLRNLANYKSTLAINNLLHNQAPLLANTVHNQETVSSYLSEHCSTPDDLFGRLIAAELANLPNENSIINAKMLILKVIYKLHMGETINLD